MPGPGDSLRLARESRGLSLEDVARETRIRIEYLDAMERDDFRALPGDVYSRGFLRNYGSYLGLNAAEVIAAYDGRNDQPRKRPRTGAIATQPAAQSPVSMASSAAGLRRPVPSVDTIRTAARPIPV